MEKLYTFKKDFDNLAEAFAELSKLSYSFFQSIGVIDSGRDRLVEDCLKQCQDLNSPPSLPISLSEMLQFLGELPYEAFTFRSQAEIISTLMLKYSLVDIYHPIPYDVGVIALSPGRPWTEYALQIKTFSGKNVYSFAGRREKRKIELEWKCVSQNGTALEKIEEYNGGEAYPDYKWHITASTEVDTSVDGYNQAQGITVQ